MQVALNGNDEIIDIHHAELQCVSTAYFATQEGREVV
jgi:hypothetical protein